MRIVTALLLVLLAPAALAQPCDPAQNDSACPDTTTWQRYFPLDVGNIWQYRESFYEEPVTHWSWTITGETEVDSQTYITLERCNEAADGSATCADPVLLRYDDANDMIVRRDGNGEVWWNELPCGMEADFNGEYECTGAGTEGETFVVPFGSYGASVPVPPDVVSDDTQKQFNWLIRQDWEMFAGLGVTKFYYELQGEPTRLVYANVGGQQVGTPAFASCDPADVDSDIACPDTTDWHRYLPLAVGNEWQYREAVDIDEIIYWGRKVIGEVEVEGQSYFQLETCEEGVDGTVTCGDPALVRYSGEYERVVAYAEDGDVWWGGVPCDLSLPFNGYPANEAGFYGCEGLPFDVVYTAAFGAYDASWSIPPDAISGDTRKYIGTPIFTGTVLYAGLGPVEYHDELHPEFTRLVYARIGGEEVGTPAFAFPTSGEPDAAQPTASTFTEVFPNPARGAVQAQYTLGSPQAVTLELIDLLGRRIRSTAMGPQAAGEHDVRIDTGGLRPGLYVLRLRGDAGAEAARRIVVVR